MKTVELGGGLRPRDTVSSFARLLPPLVLGAALNPLNSSMLSTALTRLTHSFKQDVGAGSLLITPLYITATIAQPLMGRLADLYSPRKVNLAGLLLVLIAALIGAWAPTFGWLILSRVLLGLGTSANYPSAIAILRRHFAQEGKEMPASVLGWIMVGGQAALVLGPTIGGVLTEWLGWRGIFLINIPLVLVTLWMVRWIPKEKNGQRDHSRRLDVPGILLFTGLLISLYFLLTRRPLTFIGPAALLLFLAGLIVWERRLADPFIHVRLFRQQPSLTLVYIQSVASSYILYLMLYGLPQWIEGVKDISPSKTGLLLLPMSLASAASSMLASRLKSITLITLGGIISAALACAGLFLLDRSSPLTIVTGVSIVMGVAMGTNPMANQASLNLEAPQELTGISFGLYRTFAYLGAIASGAQLKFIFHKGVTDDSFREISWFCLYSTLIMIALYLPVLIGRRMRRTTPSSVAARGHR